MSDSNSTLETPNFRELFKYEKETGVVNWINSKTGRKLEKPVGHIDNEGYLRVIIDGKRYRLHRIIWELNNGEIEHGMQVDHINGVRSDNRLCNLRLVSSRDNNCNRGAHRNGRLFGAHFHKASGKWTSTIRKNGKSTCLGYFDSEVEAHYAYKKSAETMPYA